MVRVGAVGVVNCHGRLLQAYDDGEMHASKTEQGEAETWVLWQIDWTRRLYAVQNQRTNLFLSKRDVRCVAADKNEVGIRERWTLLDGTRFQAPGRLAFRAYDGTIMGSAAPGVVTGNGGEIMAADRADPSVGAKDARWPGWFTLTGNGPVVLVEDGLAQMQEQREAGIRTPAKA